MSCDLIPSEAPGNHFQGDVESLLKVATFDLMIAFPPCTYLAVSGARWWQGREEEQEQALAFVQFLMDAPVKHWAIENPVGKVSSAIRKPDQIIQPWQFGHGETKATCLWLNNLPLLTSTNVVEGRENRVHRMPPGPNRWKERSRTYSGVAQAMADQWGQHIEAELAVTA
jgi:hypothetical protein